MIKFSIFIFFALVVCIIPSVLYALGFVHSEWVLFAVPLLLTPFIIIKAVVFRPLFRGRLLLDQNKYDEAITVFENVLLERPWISLFSFLNFSPYTKDVKAIIYLCLGVAYFNKGRFKEARKYFSESLKLDENYALPYYHLAQIEIQNNNEAEAKRLLQVSRDKGFKFGNFDQVVQETISLGARIYGR